MQAGTRLAFGPYVLDSRANSLTRGGEPVDLSRYQYRVLHLLVVRAGDVLSKDALLSAGWQDVAVGDNSVEKLIGQLHRRLDAGDRELALEARGHLYAREAARTPGSPSWMIGIVDDRPLCAAADPATEPVDLSMARAARQVWANDLSAAVPIVTAALASAPPGNGGWLLPIEPLLGVRHARDAWAPALAALHVRAR